MTRGSPLRRYPTLHKGFCRMNGFGLRRPPCAETAAVRPAQSKVRLRLTFAGQSSGRVALPVGLLAFTLVFGLSSTTSVAEAFNPASVGLMSPYQWRELYREANALYLKNDFAAAAQRYQALLNAGLEAAEIHYNAAVACAKMGETGLAVWHLERARRRAPRDEDIRVNLERLSPPENHPSPFVLLRPFLWAGGQVSLRETIAGAMAAWGTLWGALAVAAWTRPGAARRGARRLARMMGTAFVVLLMMAGAKAFDQQGRRWVIVTALNALGRTAPSEDASKAYDLPAGLKARASGLPLNGWVEIRLPGGDKTFVRSTDIRPL